MEDTKNYISIIVRISHFPSFIFLFFIFARKTIMSWKRSAKFWTNTMRIYILFPDFHWLLLLTRRAGNLFDLRKCLATETLGSGTFDMGPVELGLATSSAGGVRSQVNLQQIGRFLQCRSPACSRNKISIFYLGKIHDLFPFAEFNYIMWQ